MLIITPQKDVLSIMQQSVYKTLSTILARAAAAKSLQSCPTLCDPRDGSPPGSPVPGILQARTLEWVAIAFSNAWKWKVKSESEGAQSCPTLSDAMDCSLPGSSHHGIFQARVLEWGAIAFSISSLTTSNLPRFMDLTFQVLCNTVFYSIRLHFHHQTHPQLSIFSTLAQPLHSFWSY